MTPNRKSIAALTESGLRKCTQFYKDGVHAYCTPAEYYALCLYFDTKMYLNDYYMNKIDDGDCAPSVHYFRVKDWKKIGTFEKDKYYIDCNMVAN